MTTFVTEIRTFYNSQILFKLDCSVEKYDKNDKHIPNTL